jgi:hypothetical protein
MMGHNPLRGRTWQSIPSGTDKQMPVDIKTGSWGTRQTDVPLLRTSNPFACTLCPWISYPHFRVLRGHNLIMSHSASYVPLQNYSLFMSLGRKA